MFFYLKLLKLSKTVMCFFPVKVLSKLSLFSVILVIYVALAHFMIFVHKCIQPDLCKERQLSSVGEECAWGVPIVGRLSSRESIFQG